MELQDYDNAPDPDGNLTVVEPAGTKTHPATPDTIATPAGAS